MPKTSMNHKKVIIISAIVSLVVLIAVSALVYFLPDNAFLGALAPIRQKESFTQGFYAGTTRQFQVDNSGNLTLPTSSYLTTAWDKLGSTKLAATATSTATVTIPARDMLEVCVSIPSYAGSTDIASLQFNGDTSSTLYMSRYISIANGTTTSVDNTNISTTTARLFAIAQTNGRSACVNIANSATKDKFGAVNGFSGVATSTTSTVIEAGGFEWATSTQITSIKLMTAGGGNLAAGTGFVVFGKNF
jgi:hypothetical protein